MLATGVPISRTKIILPRRRAEVLSRKRLLDILYARLDRRLIIVSAPAGYGKTSLLIDLAHHSDLPFCWLALDPLDRDPQRFITYLIAALAQRFPQFGSRSRSVLSGLTSTDDGMEPLLVTLVNEIHDEVPEHFVLVLDDFHFLDEAQRVYAFINRFVQLIDENCHLVLASRTLPELPDIPLLVARDEVGGLDLSDLSFRPEEIQALLAQNQQIHLSDEEANTLVEATEGWITGLQFADISKVRAGESPFRRTGAVGVSVFDFLGQEVVERQPKDLQTFLLRSSLLEEFDAAVCEAALGPLYAEPQAWEEHLTAVLQRNLFALPVGADGQSVRYHHLFRDYLQGRCRRERPQEVVPVLQRLATFHEAHGEWGKAYEILKQLGDREQLANLIERAGSPMYQTAMLTLEGWLNALPPSLVRQRPGLLSLRGAVAHMRGHAAEAVRLLDAAIDQLQGGPDRGARAVALIRRGHAYRFLGRYDEAIRDASAAMEITADADDMQAIHADGLRLRGLNLYRQGRTYQAIEDLEKALETYERIQDVSLIPQLQMETGMALAALGEYQKARVTYENALEIWRRNGNLFSQANLLNNFGFLHYQLGDYERAAQAFEEGALCAKQCGYRRMEALISISMGDLYSEIEDFEIAAQNYRKAQDLTQELGDRFLTNYLMIAQANLALLKREPVRARELLDRGSAAIRAGDSRYEYGHLQLARGRLALQEGNSGQAVAELSDAKECFTQDGREMESLWGSIWLSAAYNENKEQSKAAAEIRTVQPKPNQISHSTVVAARQARDWLGGLQDDHELRSLLRGLLERVDRLDDQLPGIRRQLRRMARTLEIPVPTLTIHAFGRGQVWVNGRLVTASDWQTQAVRELFFYFVAMNKPVTKEQVGSVLWPDMGEPSRLKLRFKNEMYRLRRAIGQDTITYADEYYQLNPAVDREYDVEAFEAFLRAAKKASAPAEQIPLYQKAMDLVGGEYLQDVDAVWLAPERERLKQAFVSAGLSLAELYLGQGKAPTALEICQRVLNHESTSEAAYRLKMRIHGRLGDKASVLRTFQDCKAQMEAIFGQLPSKETQDLYLELKS